MASIWETIADKLKNKGFDVYSPGNHKGECVSKYIVVKDNGGVKIAGISSYDMLYDIMLYIPEGQYTSLEPFIDEVKLALNELKPMIISTYRFTPSYHDKEIKAYMFSMQYKNHRRC